MLKAEPKPEYYGWTFIKNDGSVVAIDETQETMKVAHINCIFGTSTPVTPPQNI